MTTFQIILAIAAAITTICIMYGVVTRENRSQVETWRRGLNKGDQVRAYGYHYKVVSVNRETGQVAVESLHEEKTAGYHLKELWPPEECQD